MTFFGLAHIAILSNWAYTQYALPGVQGLTPGVCGYNNQWSGIRFPGLFQSNSVTACMADDLPQNAELLAIGLTWPGICTSQPGSAWRARAPGQLVPR